MNNKQLYANVKAAFIARQTSLNRVCIVNGIHRQNARAALIGEWTGDAANELRAWLVKEAGIECRSSEELTPTLTPTQETLSQFLSN